MMMMIFWWLHDPDKEQQPTAADMMPQDGLKLINLLLLFYRILGCTDVWQTVRKQKKFVLMFMLYLIYFDNESNFPH